MRKLLGALALFLIVGGIGLLVPGVAAVALPTGAVTVAGACDPAWYVNADETNRRPDQVRGGFLFKGSDLIHRETSIALKDLKPGTYVVAPNSPAPDQPSFFSVEVRNTNGAYGTLRWNPGTGKWDIVIGASSAASPAVATAGTFSDADPMVLLAGKVTKWGAFDPATAKVVSFGVGYTLNPPGVQETTIRSVRFAGQTYDLRCEPAPSASASASGSAAPSSSASAVPAPNVGGGLPVTGARAAAVAVVGAALVVIGALAIRASRRKRVRFDA